MVVKCPKCQAENPETKKFCGECGTPLVSSGIVTESFTRTLETPIVGLTTGATFANRYQIIEEVGEGGMGRVYKVLDTEIDARIALKLIKPEIAVDLKTIERFRNELKTAREISHKNVCRMYHLGKHEGDYYITMEFVDGEDLKGTIRRVGPVGTGKAIAIAKQVCEGLTEAHRVGVVHRDLKPNNIMIDKDGNAKIMDFGIARSIKAKGVTGEGVMIGTPEYMSPEQAEAKEVDHRSDIYSLGVILFEMLTGQLPFSGDTPLSLALKHVKDHPEDPRTLNPQIPEDVAQLILKCLEKDKQDRYQSADELLGELTNIEKGMPTTTKESAKAKTIPSKEITVSFSLRKIFLPALAVIALITAGLIIWQPWSKKENALASSGVPFIAVLPFEDQSPQKDQEYICDGMTEQIITNLTRVPGLKVIARPSVMPYKNTQKDIRMISEELGVKFLLEGRIRKSGNQLRVSTSLIDTDEGVNLWANDYDRELQDIFEIQDDVSRSIAEALQITLSDKTSQAISGSYPKSVEAFDYYLKARYYAESKYFATKNEEDFQAALDLAKKAIEIDPDYSMGYLGIGYLYEIRWTTKGIKQDFEKERQYVQMAYELNPNLAETNAALGMIYIREGDYEKAHSLIESALKINPNNWEVQVIAGNFNMNVGLIDRAIGYLLNAVELNPLNVYVLSNTGYSFFQTGEFDRALHYLEKAYKVQPYFVWNSVNYVLALILTKDYEKAGEILELAESQPPGIASQLPAVKAVYFAAMGEKAKALDTSRSGIVFAALGMKEEALDFIAGATQDENNLYIYYYTYFALENLPIYDYLRDDPRFQEIVKKEKEKYDQKLKKYSLSF